MQKLCTKKSIIILVAFFIKNISCIALADVQITNLRDFNFGTVYPPYSTNLTQTDQVCIYNSDSTTYKITATGLYNVSNIFYMASDVNKIRYRVSWDGPQGPWISLNAGQTYSFRDASQILLCAGVKQNKLAKLRIEILSSWLSPNPRAGTYTDTLTILLEPV